MATKKKKKTAKKKTAKKKTKTKTKKAAKVKTPKEAAELMSDPKLKKKAKAALEKGAKRVSDKDVEKLVEREAEIDAKLKEVPGTFKKLVNQVKLLFEMISDYWHGRYREVPWFTIAMAVAAVIYFVSPIDIIPDFVPVIGYVDDAVVVMMAVKIAQEDLRIYCNAKGYDPNLFFWD